MCTICTYVSIHIYTYTYVHVHIHIHIHIHIHTPRSECRPKGEWTGQHVLTKVVGGEKTATKKQVPEIGGLTEVEIAEAPVVSEVYVALPRCQGSRFSWFYNCGNHTLW